MTISFLLAVANTYEAGRQLDAESDLGQTLGWRDNACVGSMVRRGDRRVE